MIPTRWAVRIMRLLPAPLARKWRRKRMQAIRERDGDDVVLQRILNSVGMKLIQNGERIELVDAESAEKQPDSR